jgi:hypothetical protein
LAHFGDFKLPVTVVLQYNNPTRGQYLTANLRLGSLPQTLKGADVLGLSLLFQ